MQYDRVRVTPPALVEDPYSGEMELSGWGDPTEHDVILWPMDSAALGETPSPGRPYMTTAGLQLSFPYGARVDHRSKVEVLSGPYAGTTAEPAGEWHVDGESAHWKSPFTGRAPGTVITLIRVRG